MDWSLVFLVRGCNGFGFFLLHLFGLLLQSITGHELKLVILVFKHGDITPISTFPTNTVKEDDWPQGYGQLTTIGMQEQYRFGLNLRKRYKSFLSKDYKRTEIYVRSTDYDRTIMSAQTALAALFPPHGNQIWKKDLPWQPVPVHTVPCGDEKLLNYPIHGCLRFQQLLNESFSPKYTESRLKHQMEFISQVAKNVGYDISTLLDLRLLGFWQIYDALLVQKIHKKHIPDWATDDFMDKLKRLVRKAILIAFGGLRREEKSRLQGGVLVKDILNKMTDASRLSNGTKMYMYSGHAMTLIALHMALGLLDKKLPEYAACHVFELYREDNGQHIVKMFYKYKSNTKYYEAVLPGCTMSCPLQEFQRLVSPFIPDNWDLECNK